MVRQMLLLAVLASEYTWINPQVQLEISTQINLQEN